MTKSYSSNTETSRLCMLLVSFLKSFSIYAKKKQRFYQSSQMMKSANLFDFYRYIDKKLFNHTSLGEIQCNDNSLTTDPRVIANIFNDYFASVFTTDDGIKPDFWARSNSILTESISHRK